MLVRSLMQPELQVFSHVSLPLFDLSGNKQNCTVGVLRDPIGTLWLFQELLPTSEALPSTSFSMRSGLIVEAMRHFRKAESVRFGSPGAESGADKKTPFTSNFPAETKFE
jgi:hypothetical protein